MPFAAFLDNLIVEMLAKINLTPCENDGTDLYSDKKLSDLEYLDEVLFLSEDLGRLLLFFDQLNYNEAVFAM